MPSDHPLPGEAPSELAAPIGSPVVAWQKGILRVHDKDDLDCTDVHVLTIDGRTVLRAIVPVHGLGDPVSDADRKLIGQALAEYLANNKLTDSRLATTVAARKL